MKAVALFSGGLDSLLAVKIIEKQGINVIPITFISHFFSAEKPVNSAIANDLDIEVIDFAKKHYKIIKSPEHGYGRGMNPCLDCHALMISEAKNFSDRIGGKFLISGEVLGQRPMSQTKSAISTIDEVTGLGDITLRPLSAGLLSPTLPERNGWVDREKLYDIQGRSRKRQLNLAGEFSIKEYSSPASGCILTDEVYSRRLHLAMKICGIKESMIGLTFIGRHFRLNESLLIVTRDEEESIEMKEIVSDTIEIVDRKGPTAVMIECCGNFSSQTEVDEDDDRILAAGILVRYTCEESADVEFPDGRVLRAEPLGKFDTEKLLIQ